MAERFAGQLAHADPLARAAALAGALAELGVQRVVLTRPDAPPRELSARATDLPGELARALDGGSFEPVVLRIPERDAAVLLEDDAWRWETGDADAADRLSAS